MLTALTILLIRQYRIAGSREEFFKWLSDRVHMHAFKVVRISIAFILIAVTL